MHKTFSKKHRSQRSQKKLSSEEIIVEDICVTLIRKNIKNLNMRVKAPYGHVEVSAPLYTPLQEIEIFIASKASWIHHQQELISNMPADSPEVIAANASEQQKMEWKAVVSACVPILVSTWEPIMGVQAGKLVFRNMKSRWGSCQPSTGRICINTRLALYPPECLEYVVVHELCHLLERGHGKRFHDLMDRFMPDWKERRAKLR